MKSNDLKHMCDNVCSEEVYVPCFMKFAALVLFRCWKKRCRKTRLRRVSSTPFFIKK